MTDNMDIPVNRYNAAGGVVVWDKKVLVLYRRLRNDFRLPKGHIEPCETPLQAAEREIGEESGYIHLNMTADLGNMQVEFLRNGVQISRNEHYYLMKVEGEPTQSSHEEDRETLWVEWNEALNLLTYEAEREWVRRAHRITGG